MVLEGFQKPARLNINKETLTDNYGSFYAQPFEKGFGITVGNALRRVLISSIEGAAITAVKIGGVLHEFSTIPGVVEDVTDIILNLKQIPIRLMADHQKIISISTNEIGPVSAGMLKHDADIKILDPNLHIATIGDRGKLEMEMVVQKGRGYIPAERNVQKDLGIGYIPLDSVHSPVQKVKYHVEPARVGQSSQYEKLTLEIWTNGTISPVDALSHAAEVLSEHLDIFIRFDEAAAPAITEEARKAGKPVQSKEALDKSIEELDLGVRAYNCLKNANIYTLRDLVTKTESDLLKTKHFGRKSLQQVKHVLDSLGLSLGMETT
ncbi:MAG TPA: DNA-directed RNA polymerase subunit alpha [Acidobacteriota bacterium]|nr:DNA-directed RNA polymerase subunit alpha [Acidobacteriota bacterium]